MHAKFDAEYEPDLPSGTDASSGPLVTVHHSFTLWGDRLLYSRVVLALQASIPPGKVAFVVFYSRPPEPKQSGANDANHTLPSWAEFDRDHTKVDDMIRLNFESARLTHPLCRLVILTDTHTEFSLHKVDPGVSGYSSNLPKAPPLCLSKHTWSICHKLTRLARPLTH